MTMPNPEIESEIINTLKGIHDPEVPVNIYDLGLVYGLELGPEGAVKITMTLTAPNCPMADQLVAEVKSKLSGIEGVITVDVNLTFDPPWDQSMLSDEARLELGLM